MDMDIVKALLTQFLTLRAQALYAKTYIEFVCLLTKCKFTNSHHSKPRLALTTHHNMSVLHQYTYPSHKVSQRMENVVFCISKLCKIIMFVVQILNI